jgi:hypothetical protein
MSEGPPRTPDLEARIARSIEIGLQQIRDGQVIDTAELKARLFRAIDARAKNGQAGRHHPAAPTTSPNDKKPKTPPLPSFEDEAEEAIESTPKDSDDCIG